MENDKKFTVSTSGIGFNGALFITFLVLKLTHVIDWSWWWITAPLWIPAGLGVLLFILALVCYVLSESESGRSMRW